MGIIGGPNHPEYPQVFREGKNTSGSRDGKEFFRRQSEEQQKRSEIRIEDLAKGRTDASFGVAEKDTKSLIIRPTPFYTGSDNYFEVPLFHYQDQPEYQPTGVYRIPIHLRQEIAEVASAADVPIWLRGRWVIYNADLARQLIEEEIPETVTGSNREVRIRTREQELLGGYLESAVIGVEYGFFASSIRYANPAEAQKSLHEINQLFQYTKTTHELINHSESPQGTQSTYRITGAIAMQPEGQTSGQTTNVQLELTVSNILPQDRYILTISPSNFGGPILHHLNDHTDGIPIHDQEAVYVGLKPVSQINRVEGTLAERELREYVYINQIKLTETLNTAIADITSSVQPPDMQQLRSTLHPVRLREHLLGIARGPYTIEINQDSGQTNPVTLAVEMVGISPGRETSQVGDLIGFPARIREGSLVDVPYVRFLFSADDSHKDRARQLAVASATAFEKMRIT